MTLRVIFAGTPEFAIPCLERLVESDSKVVAVLTQPDQKKGRGQKLSAPPVKSFALKCALPVIQTNKICDETIRKLLLFRPDIVVVVAFGLRIPEKLLYQPPLGCVNVHASLLPRWRGAAPVARAIEAGDIETGVSIMQMDSGLDTGGILSQMKVEIADDDTTGTLESRLSHAGATELMRVWQAISQRKLQAVAQNEEQASYAKKMTKSDAGIDWHNCAAAIVCKIRACNPWPVAYSWLDEQRVQIWEAQVSNHGSNDVEPGTVVSSDKHHVIVSAGQGAVRLETVQKDGKKRMKIRDFVAGNQITTGSVFEYRKMPLSESKGRS